MVQCLPALKKIPFLYFHIYSCLQVFGRIKHGNENGRFHECCSSFLECRYIVGDVQLHRTAPQSSVVCTQWTQLWFLGLFKKWRFWQTPGARTFHSKTSSLGWLIWLIPADNRQSQMVSLFYFFLNLIFFARLLLWVRCWVSAMKQINIDHLLSQTALSAELFLEQESGIWMKVHQSGVKCSSRANRNRNHFSQFHPAPLHQCNPPLHTTHPSVLSLMVWDRAPPPSPSCVLLLTVLGANMDLDLSAKPCLSKDLRFNSSRVFLAL